MIGRTLSNRYKIIAELGSGGMAWVYLAEDQVEGGRVAIKVLYPQHSQDLGFLQRFIREAKLSMALSQSAPQPNVVRVLDYGADRDTHYLVMEYVPARDLGEILTEEGALEWQRALYLARQVALALDHAHHHEIVHRDIKPSNIMVLRDGTVRVLDFGIARARTSPELTLSGFVGSPNYVAPEQATGQTVDVRADIYSLGVVLYRMLSGDLPFQGETPWAIVNQHIAAPPPNLGEVRPEVPEPVVRLVDRMLAKRREDRFQTPAEVIEAIEAVLAGEELPDTIIAPPPTETAEALYERARQAMAGERWHEAIDLFSRVLKIDPEYRDVSEQLSQVGHQIRLAALYRHAHRAVEGGRWQMAIDEIAKIEEMAPGYKDVAALRTQAERRERMQVPGGSDAGEFPTQESIEEEEEKPGAAVVGATVERAPLAQADRPRRRWWPWAAAALILLLAAGAAWAAFGGISGDHGWPAALIGRTTATDTATPPQPTAVAATRAATAPPTATRPRPSATPSPTASPRPTHTPRATGTQMAPIATATPTSTATPTATQVAAATDEPELAGWIAFPRFDTARRTYDVYQCQADGEPCTRVAMQASQPDFLPGGQRLVVRSWDTENKGLFVIDSRGQRVWRITEQIEAARPSVDAQGEHYVYHSRQEADREARIYRAFGTEVRVLEREGDTVRGKSPAWTPNGKILYTGCLGNACGILLMSADGAAPRQVVAGTTESNAEASPDGQHIAFMSRRDGDWEVYIAAADGSNLVRVTDYAGNDGLPTWSPDGSWLAFVSDRDGAWAVWGVRADGSDLRRLFPIGGPLEGPVAGAAPHELQGWVEERITWE
ncbi:MAG: protein kinase [Anaerolineae bacterium]|nr:protein kinase [Anaerolineae bacterium]